MNILAKAKINLALHVTGRSKYGYHFLDSLVAFPNFGDVLVFKENTCLALKVSGPFKNDLKIIEKSNENIVIQAAKLLKMPKNKSYLIHLRKNLPVSAGIGGGSADAAATIKALSALCGKKLPNFKKLLALGADVPVCLKSDFQRMRGIGENLVSLPTPPTVWVVLVNPKIPVSTKRVFESLTNFNCQPLQEIPSLNDTNSFFEYVCKQRNDLQATTCLLFPEVRKTLEMLTRTDDCRLVRMSGSGSTCFGLYNREIKARQAALKISKFEPTFWVKVASLFSSNS